MVLENWKRRTIIKETFPLLTALAAVGVISGLILEAYKKTLIQYPQLLLLIPVMIGMGGNLGAILASRTSTALHLGIIELTPKNKALRNNIIAIIILATIIFTLTGILTHPISQILNIGNQLSITQITLISLTSGIMISLITIAITIISTYLSYTHGLDPDNTVLPIVTSLSDIAGILIFYLTALYFI